MRTTLIAGIAVAVLIAAAVWFAVDQGVFGPADEAEAPRDTASAPSSAQTARAPETTTPASDDGKAAGAPDTASTTSPTTPAATTGDDDGGDSAKVETVIADRTDAAADTATELRPPPAFDVVRIAREGTAVLAGRGPPGAVVELRRDGETVGETTADAAGEWVMVLDDPMPEGPAELGLVARMPDGSEVTAEATLAVDVPERKAPSATAVADAKDAGRPGPVAVLVPHSGDKSSRIMQRPAAATADTPDVTVDKVDYDEAGNVVVAGTAAPGKTVRLYVDNEPVGDTQASDDGQWSLTPDRPIVAGPHTLRADRLDAKGTVEARVEIPFDRAPRRDILKFSANRRVIVQPGNSLWRISRRVYGDGMRFTVIYQANTAQIRDPDLIYPGQVFDLPAEDGRTVTN